MTFLKWSQDELALLKKFQDATILTETFSLSGSLPYFCFVHECVVCFSACLMPVTFPIMNVKILCLTPKFCGIMIYFIRKQKKKLKKKKKKKRLQNRSL